MKKIISLLVVIALIATLATTAFAAKVGETVEVAFVTEGNPGFAAFEVALNYDAEALTLVGLAKGKLCNADGSFAKNLKNGKATYAHTENSTGDGVLFVATFEITDKAVAGTKYTVSATLNEKATANAAAEKVTFGIKSVEIEIEGEHVHAWTEWAEVKAPTCTEYGVEERTCACGETETRQGAKPLGHAFGEWKNIGNPNYHEHVCVRCDAKENEPHDFEKTETAEKITWTCKVCGYTKEQGLDPVPGTGDITPIVVTSAFAVIAMITLAGYMLKRKFAL